MVSLEDFQLVDGVYFPKTPNPLYDDSKAFWEDSAASRLEKKGDGVQKPGGIWWRFPEKRHFETIVDLGCGYGRHAIYLSEDRGVTCDRYYAIDISEVMLRHLLGCKAHFNFFPTAETYLICMPLKVLPLVENVADLVYSSSVFMHLQDADTQLALAEVYRILKPGSSFIFNDSFHNKNCPSYKISYFFRRFTTPEHNPIRLRQYTLAKLETLIANSRIAEKSGDYTIVPSQYEVLPKNLQDWLPGGKRWNDRAIKKATSEMQKNIYANAYSVYSNNLGL